MVKHAENAWVSVITSFFDVIKKAIPWGFSALIVYFLAGKNTNVNFLANLIAKLSVDKWAAWILASITSGWALRERHLKRKTIERYSPRVKELEKELNPKRKSSGLLPTGENSEED